ncbi:MAG: tRNA 2'-O-methylase [Planctomycetes bacterium ADurb.Bin401]|nr:MAG: tRNA 2'-O-methylase [Planctomycetes bacterium ADurb.Bin401]
MKYKIPTIEQCYQLLKLHNTPDHIIRHCEAAAGLAVEIAKKISASGTKVDIDFVHRGCLLHDILRLCGKGHEDAACQILKHDYPELALAIKKHAYRAIIDEEMKPRTIEEKIIYYADKRVMHDKVVPLMERLEEGHRRNNPAGCKKTTAYIDSLIVELEKELNAGE